MTIANRERLPANVKVENKPLIVGIVGFRQKGMIHEQDISHVFERQRRVDELEAVRFPKHVQEGRWRYALSGGGKGVSP